jgi:hypothetical protein
MTKTKESIKYENVTARALYATNLKYRNPEKNVTWKMTPGPAWRFIKYFKLD